MRILINVPPLYILGGVANHYMGLKPYWSEIVKYNYVGGRTEKEGSGKWWLPWDILKFIGKIILFRPNVIVLNPSFDHNGIVRDFFFLKLSKLFRKKVVIFMHGFNWDYAKTVDRDYIAQTINKADLLLVLASMISNEFKAMGVTIPMAKTTTKVDDRLLENNSDFIRSKGIKNILYVGRLEKNKGIYESLNTYAILKKKYPNLRYTMVGDGSEKMKINNYINSHNIKDVVMTGSLNGKDLSEQFIKGDLFLFLSYREGMPTSVLEAMAFGMPIITRAVGGLPDFFENGKMGVITDSLNPEKIAELMTPYIDSIEKVREVSYYNHNYALEHFMASSVAKKLEELLRDIN